MSRRFPPEILSEIFLQSLPVRDQTKATIPPSHPVILTGVCQYWRAVAQSTPSLWSDLDLPNAPKKAQAREEFFQALQTWLSNSKNQPLSLCLSSLERRRSVVRQYLSILCSYSVRWKNIILILRCDGDPDIIPPIPSSSLPLLERFYYSDSFLTGIRVDRDYGVPPTWTLKDQLSSAPNLHEVQIRHPLAFQLFPSSSSITSISLDLGVNTFHRTFHLGRLLTSLLICDGLEKLTVTCHDYQSDIIVDNEGIFPAFIRLPRVSSLTLAIGSVSLIFGALMRALRLPCLRTLHFDSNGWLSHELPLFLARHSHIEGLFAMNGMFTVAMTSVFDVLPRLSTLATEDLRKLPSTLLRELTLVYDLKPDGSSVLHSGRVITLEHLILCSVHPGMTAIHDYPQTESEYYDRVMRLVQSRWRLPTNALDFDGRPMERLKSFRMRTKDKVDMMNVAPNAYAKLLEFRDEGLEVGFGNMEELKTFVMR